MAWIRWWLIRSKFSTMPPGSNLRLPAIERWAVPAGILSFDPTLHPAVLGFHSTPPATVFCRTATCRRQMFANGRHMYVLHVNSKLCRCTWMNTLINLNYASIYDKLCYLNVEAVFRSIFQNSKNFVNRLHRVLNVVEKNRITQMDCKSRDECNEPN